MKAFDDKISRGIRVRLRIYIENLPSFEQWLGEARRDFLPEFAWTTYQYERLSEPVIEHIYIPLYFIN